MKNTESDEVEKVYQIAQNFCRQARKLVGKEQMIGAETEKREKVGAALHQTIDESKRLLELLHILCPFCRKAGGRPLGECAKCHQEICSLCAVQIKEKFVHRDICARFFEE